MHLETVTSKHINDLERLVMELQQVMRKAGLQNESVAKSLHDFEDELGKVRRARFDAGNSEYASYQAKLGLHTTFQNWEGTGVSRLLSILEMRRRRIVKGAFEEGDFAKRPGDGICEQPSEKDGSNVLHRLLTPASQSYFHLLIH